MKTWSYFFIVLAITFSAVMVKAQPCCCQKFPFYYCNEAASDPNSTLQQWCTDDPYNDGPPSTGGVLGPTVPVKAPGIWGCIQVGDIYSCGNVAGGVDSLTSSRPGLNVDVDTSTLTWSIGELFTPDWPGGPNGLEASWGWPGGLIQNCMPGAKLDTSCCITIVFESDVSWWQQRLGPEFDPATSALGMVIRNWNSSCQMICDPSQPGTNNIYINTCPGFFTSQSNPNQLPNKLDRDYVNLAGRPGQASGDIEVGVLDDSIYTVNVGAAYDFTSIIMHEMGHWLGLPERDDDSCENTNGQPCNDDPNSFMTDLKAGQQRFWGDTEDCCWLNKLYNPSSIEACDEATQTCMVRSSVSDSVAVGPLKLIPAYPNPTSGETTLGFINGRIVNYTFDVCNVLGQVVYTIAMDQIGAPGSHSFTIPANTLAPGTYIYSLRVGGVVLSKKLSVAK